MNSIRIFWDNISPDKSLCHATGRVASALLLVRPGESDAGVLDGAGGSAGASRLARIGASAVVLAVPRTMITMVGVLWTPPGGSRRLDRTRYTD